MNLKASDRPEAGDTDSEHTGDNGLARRGIGHLNKRMGRAVGQASWMANTNVSGLKLGGSYNNLVRRLRLRWNQMVSTVGAHNPH